MATSGASFPPTGGSIRASCSTHLYADYEVHPHFQPFVQLSGIYYIESGNGQRGVNTRNGPTIPLDTAQHALGTGHFEGGDILNLGSRGVDNNDYVTWAIGAHIPLTQHLTWSFAYERPFTRKDITKQRMTTALVLEF